MEVARGAAGLLLALAAGIAMIEPGATLIGVEIPAGRRVPAGATLTVQAAADALPEVDPDAPLARLRESELHLHTSLAAGERPLPPAVPTSSTPEPR